MPLPFADDKRSVQVTPISQVPDEPVNIANKVISALSIRNYTPASFPNPVLTRHYANIASIALRRTDTEEVVDFTYPANERIDGIVGDSLAELNQVTCRDLRTKNLKF